jgi:hypothetical protein
MNGMSRIKLRPSFASATPDQSPIAYQSIKLQSCKTRAVSAASGGRLFTTKRKNVMSHRQMVSLAAVAALGIACVSAEAFAAVRGAAGGGAAVAHRGGVGVGGAAVGYRGGYYRPGVGLAAGAVVGGAIAASQYGYGGYAYDQGYDGYGPGYSSAIGLAPPYGGYPYGAYPYGGNGQPNCTYVGGPKSSSWTC